MKEGWGQKNGKIISVICFMSRIGHCIHILQWIFMGPDTMILGYGHTCDSNSQVNQVSLTPSDQDKHNLSLYPHTLMYQHGTWIEEYWGRGTYDPNYFFFDATITHFIIRGELNRCKNIQMVKNLTGLSIYMKSVSIPLMTCLFLLFHLVLYTYLI